MKHIFALLFVLLSVTAIQAQEIQNTDNRQVNEHRGRRHGNRPMRKMMNPEDMAKMETDAIDKAVNLDSLQYQLVFILKYSDITAIQDSMKARAERRDAMREKNMQQRNDNRKSNENWMKAREDVMKKRREAINEQMKQILTSKQYKKYLKYEKNREEQHKKAREQRLERNND